MAVKDVTLEDLERRLGRVEEHMATKADLADMEARIKEAGAKNSREQANRVIEAIQRGTSANF